MTKYKIWIKVVPQITRELMNSLYACRAVWEQNVPKDTFFIADVYAFTLDISSTSEPMYRIGIETENNTKSIFVHKDNMLEFTLHFGSVINVNQ